MKKLTLILAGMIAVFMMAGCSSDDGNNAAQQETAAVETTVEASQDAGTTATQKPAVSEKKAKEMALEKVPGAKESDLVQFHLDTDNGRQEYEGEIVYGEKEYSFEIDANTGKMVSWEEESVHD